MRGKRLRACGKKNTSLRLRNKLLVNNISREIYYVIKDYREEVNTKKKREGVATVTKKRAVKAPGAKWSTFVTPQEKAVQSALDTFWYEHYTKEYTSEQRNQLVEDFSEKWLSAISITKPFIRHPATKLKRFNRELTVGEVLADFILRIDQVEEREAEYPVNNPDRERNTTQKREVVERSIFFQGWEDEIEKVPAYSVTESDFEQANSIEDVLFPNQDPSPTVSKFIARLRHVKKYANFYATSFAEEYKYDKADAKKRIRRLDLSRVRECQICGGAFYAHDLRLRNCDCQQEGSEKLSTCQKIAKKTADLMRIKSII